ncbi:hypothetical protein ACFWM3_08240 [Gottfriedia sp. NPDC058432]|uniref:hypothetical protein n=1 Tax=Gottfriedia sp. NPDC058432 TaxID=3346497 RepID=UPI0036603C19
MKKVIKKTLPVVLSAAMVSTAIPSLTHAETFSSSPKISKSVAVTLERPEQPEVQAIKNSEESTTGYINVTWKSLPGAIGYKVGIFNGESYDYFDTGNTTSWSSKDKGIWPTDEEINQNHRYQLHLDGKGTEIPTNPAGIYYNAYAASMYNEEKDFRLAEGVSVGIVAVYPNGTSEISDTQFASFPELDQELIDKASPYIDMDSSGQFSVNNSSALSTILSADELQLVQQNVTEANQLNQEIYYSSNGGSVSVGTDNLTYTVNEFNRSYIDGVTKLESYWWGYKIYLSKNVVRAAGVTVSGGAGYIASTLPLPFGAGIAAASIMALGGYLASTIPHGVIIRVNKVPTLTGIKYIPTWVKYQSN